MNKITSSSPTARLLGLALLAMASLQAQAIIVNSNSDAVEQPPSIRLCSTNELTQPAAAASLCALAGVNGATADVALAAARSIVPQFGWNVGNTGRAAMGPLSAAEALRLVEIPNLSDRFGLVLTGTRQAHFVGTWTQAFSGPLLLQVAEFPYGPNVITRNVYYYWLPNLQAVAGDNLNFTPGLGEPIAFVGLYTLAPIPEPGTVGLMALGLGVLAWRAKRRQVG